MRNVQAMMLAAGLGTRLWPLTATRGKPAVPFRGRPLIRGMLDWLADHGVRDVVVNTHHQPASIEAALADPPPQVTVRFSPEPEILGTAGGLARARDAGLLDPDRTTLIVNAKLVTEIDLSRAAAVHRASGAAATLVLRPNRAREAFTTVRVEGDRVEGFGPSRVPEGPNPLLFTGIHLLEPELLRRAQPVFSDTIRDLYPPEIAARRVLAHVDEARWEEFSTLDRYLELQLSGLEPPRTVVAEGAAVASGAALSDCVVWPGARVEAGARLSRCVIAEGVTVPARVDLRDAVLFPESWIASAPPGAPTPVRGPGFAWVPVAGAP